MSEMADRLMDVAQARIQEAGYGSFSFRDLATAVGIKNPSVHHHFPTKGAIAAAIGRRYAKRFFEAVAPRRGETPGEVIEAYRVVFREGIASGQMCLFGMMGAEYRGLPEEVTVEIEAFFKACVADLERRVGGDDAKRKARHVMAVLEGAQILVRVHGDIETFDDATMTLTAQFQ